MTNNSESAHSNESGTIQHVGRFAIRLVGDFEQARRERAFAELWQHENRADRYTIPLALGVLCAEPSKDSYSGLRQNRELTQEIATDAATIIQWLGTNVGWSFLEQAVEACGYKIVRAKR